MRRSVLRSKVNGKMVRAVGGRSWSSGEVRVGRESSERWVASGGQGRSLEGRRLSRGHREHPQLIWKD